MESLKGLAPPKEEKQQQQKHAPKPTKAKGKKGKVDPMPAADGHLALLEKTIELLISSHGSKDVGQQLARERPKKSRKAEKRITRLEKDLLTVSRGKGCGNIRSAKGSAYLRVKQLMLQTPEGYSASYGYHDPRNFEKRREKKKYSIKAADLPPQQQQKADSPSEEALQDQHAQVQFSRKEIPEVLQTRAERYGDHLFLVVRASE